MNNNGSVVEEKLFLDLISLIDINDKDCFPSGTLDENDQMMKFPCGDVVDEEIKRGFTFTKYKVFDFDVDMTEKIVLTLRKIDIRMQSFISFIGILVTIYLNKMEEHSNENNYLIGNQCPVNMRRFFKGLSENENNDGTMLCGSSGLWWTQHIDFERDSVMKILRENYRSIERELNNKSLFGWMYRINHGLKVYPYTVMTSTIGTYSIYPTTEEKFKIKDFKLGGNIYEMDIDSTYTGAIMIHIYTINGKFNCTLSSCGFSDIKMNEMILLIKKSFLYFIKTPQVQDLSIQQFLENVRTLDQN